MAFSRWFAYRVDRAGGRHYVKARSVFTQDVSLDITGKTVFMAVENGNKTLIQTFRHPKMSSNKQAIGGKIVKHKVCPVEEAVKTSDMTYEEEPEICILKTRELLSRAQLLMRDIEELLDWCTVTGPSNRRRCRMIQQECQASVKEDGETLVVEGFRFKSAASRDDLRKLSSQAGARGRQGDT